jgi:hypothetical protein
MVARKTEKMSASGGHQNVELLSAFESLWNSNLFGLGFG